MKFAGASAANAADGPRPAPPAALIFGPDRGHSRDVGDGLAARREKDVGKSLTRVRLSEDDLKADPARVADLLTSSSLFGDEAVVRLRLVGEAQASHVLRLLEQIEEGLGGDGMLIVEAGELAVRSRLRKAFEDARLAASYQLYEATAQELGRLLDACLARDGISLEDEARALILESVAPERDAVRAEAEKLALYAKGATQRVTVTDVRALGVGGRESDADEAAFAALSGRAADASKALLRAFGAGAAPVQAVRTLERQARNLLDMRAAIAAGQSQSELMARVFRPRQAETARQMERWSRPDLERLLYACRGVEIGIKRAGAADQALVERLILDAASKSFSAVRS